MREDFFFPLLALSLETCSFSFIEIHKHPRIAGILVQLVYEENHKSISKLWVSDLGWGYWNKHR